MQLLYFWSGGVTLEKNKLNNLIDCYEIEKNKYTRTSDENPRYLIRKFINDLKKLRDGKSG